VQALCFFFLWAAGLACLFSVAVAAITFVLLVAEIGMVVIKFATMKGTMAEQTDDEKEAKKPGGNVTDEATEKTAAELQVAKEPPLATPASPVIRVAEFDYAKQREDELSFSTGDRIEVVNERTDGWAKGILIDAEEDPKPQGMFPLNYTAPGDS